jgi:ATP-dependent helicase HepA
MNDLLHIASAELARYLEAELPKLSDDWWEKHVVPRLSFPQQRMLNERRIDRLRDLDFAALLRLLDQNWYDLSNAIELPREGRTWVKELQTVRNKWAHISTEAMPPSEVYRDSDTLGRLLSMIDSPGDVIANVNAKKEEAVAAMAMERGVKSVSPDEGGRPPRPASPESESSDEPTVGSLYKVGDLVSLRSDQAVVFPVIEVLPGGGECRYTVFQDNAKANYYESQLQKPADQLDEPRQLSAREIQSNLTSLHILSPSTANLFSLRSGRIKFVPYQYRPVLKLIRADRPRLLIADEVGVGKTIEAGLIIKELQARTDLSSVLIICPKALVAERKWFLELKRFDEHFTALDGKTLRHCLQETDLEGEWPAQYSKAILPHSLFDSDLILGPEGRRRARNPSLLDLDPPPKFDLVIVDEAHHIRNSETFLHQGVRYFCDNAEAVLLLTATPIQMGTKDLFTILNVIRPDLIIDQASFAQMSAPNRHINEAVAHCRRADDDWQANALGCLDEVAQTEWGRLFLRETQTFQNAFDQLSGEPLPVEDRVQLIRDVEEMYTFSGIINRTRRRDIGEFTTRKAETLTIDFTPAQKELHDGLLAVIARILIACHGARNVVFMMTTIRRQAASCLYGLSPLLHDILNRKLEQVEFMEACDCEGEADFGFLDSVREDIERLQVQAADLDPHDPKIEAFVRIITEKGNLPNNKALVFSTFRHTLAYLYRHLQPTGLRVGLIHGSIPDSDRADIRRRFGLDKADADAVDVLLSSEVGCEGLDFQFCDFLVNYDLPWNPMRIEQRIGRIDRYGQQSESVAIKNFVTPGTVDADIYTRCLMRIGIFQSAIGGNEEILGEITQQIHEIADSFDLTQQEREEQLRQLADNQVRQIQEEQQLETNQAELFGLNIPKESWRQDIEAAESFWLSPAAIQQCIYSFLAARLGDSAEHLLGDKPLKTLRLNQEARSTLLGDFQGHPRPTEPVARAWQKWLKGIHPTLSVTFDQDTAAENPEAVHLSVFHPLVRQAAQTLKVDAPVCASLTTTAPHGVDPGKYHFALYSWKKRGVRIDETLVPVATDPILEEQILSLLETASDDLAEDHLAHAEQDALEQKHHAKWLAAQADHIAANRQQVEHRIQSLTASHRARTKAIEDQIERATDDRITLMKQSELARANVDYDRRIELLRTAAESGDIHATAILFGIILITPNKP